jgi:hypothetical protein
VPLLPVAAFLAGALLSLLLPVALLTALSLWYMFFVRRVPETTEADMHGLPDPEVLAGDAPSAEPGAKPGSRPL